VLGLENKMKSAIIDIIIIGMIPV